MTRLSLGLLASVAFANARELGLFDIKGRLVERGDHHFAIRSLEQTEDSMDVLAYCQELEENNWLSSSTCACEMYSDGVIGVKCLDSCLYCDDSGLSCGNYSTISNLTDTFEFGLGSLQTFQYDGAGGIYGNVTVDIQYCDESFSCGECVMFVNSSQCNSCEFCADGVGIAVDCENLVEGSSFSICEDSSGDLVIPGVFQGFAYNNVSCPEPPPPPPPANDNCTDSIMLQIGDTIAGTASGATADDIPSCSLIENQAAGVWYQFEGNGSPILVSTCLDTYNESSSAETYVSVYQGSTCGQLECLPNYYQVLSCGGLAYGGSSIAMESTKSVIYYVHISSRYEGSFPSQFSLSVSSYTKPTNDECSKSREIAVDSVPVRGTVNRSVVEDDTLSTPCGLTMDFDGGTGMAWYEITPTKNATLRASTCSSGTAGMSTGLTVVRGDCDGQTCLAESGLYVSNCGDGGSIVDFDVVADGSNYSIVVWGPIAGELGFFELDIRSLNPPENNGCNAAVGLLVDGPNVTGTLFDSTSSVDEQDASCLFPYDGSGGGVWYSFTGTGGFVSASSCSDVYSHYISIYEGECGGSLKCVASPSSVTPKGCDAIGGKSSPVQTIEGVTYYVLVSQSGGVLSDGSFDLSVKTVTPPTNNECSAAIEVIPDDDTRIVGNTVDAFYDKASLLCDHGTSSSPALWYLVRGTGETMRADTCSNYTNFDTVISILEGPCGVANSTCLVSNDDSCGSLSSSVIWSTESGVDYYIRVAGLGDGQVGDFGLRVSTFEAAPNDACSGAIKLTIGGSLSASMEGASPGDFTPACFSDSSTPGIWYYVDGLGSALSISTCEPDGNGTFSGRIQVFQGSNCTSGLECTGFAHGNDCFSSSSASVKFFAEEGQRYYVLFLGYWDDSSDSDMSFTVTVTEFEPAENDACEGAVRMDSSILSILGSTEDSLPDSMSCSQDFIPEGTAPGVWYAVQGSGRPMLASTCSSELTMDTSLNVFSGRCDQLACVAYGTPSYDGTCAETSYGSSRVIFQTELNQTYYVLVAGMYSESVGDFGLTISDVDAPSNDRCTMATEVIPNTGTIIGSTVNASSPVSLTTTFTSNETSCSYNPNSPGLWYSLNGTGQGFVISTCSNETTFETAISVSSGSCGRMKCITSAAYNDYSCSSGIGAATAVIGTEIGVEYLIFVHGANENMRGDFGLTVSSFDLAPNDLCSGALTILPDNVTIFGSTLEATDGTLGCSINVPNMDDDSINDNNNNNLTLGAMPGSPDLWYRVDGTGGRLLASTCGGNTTYDSQLEILEAVNGTCTTLSCIVSSDDSCGMGSEVEWFATRGKTYFIRVFGYSTNRGQFQLTVSTP